MKSSTVFIIFAAAGVAAILGAVAIARKTGGKLVVVLKHADGSAVTPHNVVIIKGRSGPVTSPLQKKVTEGGSVEFENLEIGEYYYVAVITNNETGISPIPEISGDVVLINWNGNLLNVTIGE